MMWAAHCKYLEIRNAIKPGHPWYFVNLAHNVGAPVKRRNAYSLLKDACQAQRFPWPDFPHSLRHMYGDVIKNRMGIDLHFVSVAMRHSSFLSTLTYTNPSTQTVHNAISAAKGKCK
jgi:integrase